MRLSRAIIASLLLTSAAAGCKSEQTEEQPEIKETDVGESPRQNALEPSEEQGLIFSLSSDPVEDDDSGAVAREIQGEPLSEARTEALLDRLPDLPADTGAASFKMRSSSLPAPTTGDEIDTPFPLDAQAQAPDAAQSGAFRVLRFAPEGDVPLARQLSVTFSHPAVSLTSQAQAARIQPATLSPDIPGSWRWIGTRTALFTPEAGRFPMANEFTVSIPADFNSARGDSLDEPAQWRFETPALSVEEVWPASSPWSRQDIGLEPTIFVGFDQRIDPTALRDYLFLKANGRSFDYELLAENPPGSDVPQALFERFPADRRILLRPAAPLPKDTPVSVEVVAGAPSAEGPLRTKALQTHSFRTFGPLRILDHSCDNPDYACPPNAAWWISASNELDADAFDLEMITVSPPVDDLDAELQGNGISLRGSFLANTLYEVTVSGDLKDQRGQTLGAPNTLTFHVGPMPPLLFTGMDTMNILDPGGDDSIAIQTANVTSLRVHVHRVTPDDWEPYQDTLRQFGRRDKLPALPGERLTVETLQVQDPGDVLRTTRFSLKPWLDQRGRGQLVIAVEVDELTPKAREDRRSFSYQLAPNLFWIQATDLGVDLFHDRTDALIWTTDLTTGEPIEGVDVSILDTQASATSNADGLARFALPATPTDSHEVLVARTSDDLAIMPEYTAYWHTGTQWRKRDPEQPRTLVHTFDDRAMYRPAESIEIKGWLRTWTLDARPRLALPDADELKLIFSDARGAKLGEATTQIDDMGGFHLAFDIPDNANLGPALANIVLGDASIGSHSFQIQEFRTPEFKVSVDKPAGPHVVGDLVPLTARATYYAGGPLAGSEGTWTVKSNQTTWRPPNWDGFVFGRWTPWWYWQPSDDRGERRETREFSTDALGQSHLTMRLHDANPAVAMNVSVDAAVTDVNGQRFSGSTSMLVHPADVYVGLRSAQNFVKKGDTIAIDAAVVDLAGKLVAQRTAVITAERLAWTYKGREWTQSVVDTQTCEITSTDEPSRCDFEARDSGQIRITATVFDSAGRESQTRLFVWVAGEQPRPPKKVELQSLRLIPDQQTYEPGQKATLLVQSPIETAEGLLTVFRGSLSHTERFQIEQGAAELTIDVDPADIPNLNVHVDIAGPTPRVDHRGQPIDGAPPRPALASGRIQLKVSRAARALNVALQPEADAVAPGADTHVDVEITDASGDPVPDAQVALVVVDEAILALSGYTLPDPLSTFYPSIPNHRLSQRSRPWISLQSSERPEDLDEGSDREPEARPRRSALPMMDGAIGGRMYKKGSFGGARGAAGPPEPASAPIDLREDFRALAVFRPALRTDEDGRVRARFTMPDNLTQYRILAVSAHDATDFGKAEGQLTARLPLMVRPSPPRFLNYGDQLELRVVVQNPRATPAPVELAARANNLNLADPLGRAFEVPAGDRVELRLPASTHKSGDATVQFAVTSGAFADASQVSFPVWTPATTEAFATYGTLDGDGATSQAVRMPDDVLTDFGTLDISTSSTALQALTDAFIYLLDYPFACSEQIASRLLSAVALAPVLDAFDAEGLPPRDELDAQMQRWVDLLLTRQSGDGAFGLWRLHGRHYPYASVHAIHALFRAHARGLDVPDFALERSADYLEQIRDKIPSWYSAKTRDSITAYAHYTARIGDADYDWAGAALRLANDSSDFLTLEAIGWLMATLHDQPRAASRLADFNRTINNRAAETASTAQFAVDYDDLAYLVMHSDRRVDAVILDALIRHNPKHDLIPKVARGLLAHRKRGRWSSTQDNVFVLLALKQYFDAFESQTPNFVARAWLGDDFAAEHTFRGRSTDTKTVTIPLKAVDERVDASRATRLTLQKDGPGRLYYRLGMSYAPASLKVDAADHGFALLRRYEPVDDPNDVEQLDDGSWRIRLGARVRVRLDLALPAPRYHVALVDKLPGGFEVLNPALAVTEPIPDDPTAADNDTPYWWWSRPWYEHQNLRTERVEAFTSLLWSGVHEYTYVTRATTPGTFVVPPAKAEEMYQPETFGRTATETVRIVASP